MPSHPLNFPLSKLDTLICFLERNKYHDETEDSPSKEVVEGELHLLTLLLVQEGCSRCSLRS